MRPLLTKLFCLGLGWAGATALAGPLAYPETPRRPVSDTFHGTTVQEDYRWLEQTDSPEVKTWIGAQNTRTRREIDALPQRAAIKDELLQMVGSGRASRYAFDHAGGRLFALKRQPPKNQDVLVMLPASGDVAGERVVLDPTVLDASGKTTIDWFKPSFDGKLVAVSLSKNGSEDGTLHLYRTDTGKPLPDVVPRVQYPTGGGSVAWARDGRGFFYTRYPQGQERPPAGANFYQQVYFHTLGTPAKADTYVIGREFPRIAEIALQASEDGRHLLADVANGDGGEHGFYLRSGAGPWRRIADYTDGIRRAEFGRDGRLYALALKGSPRGRIVAMKLGDRKATLPAAPTVVAQSGEVIESFLPTDHKLYVEVLVGGPSQLHVHTLEGKPLGSVDAQPIASVVLGARLKGDTLLFGSQSFVQAFSWYTYDGAKKGAAPVKTALTDAPAFAVDGGLPGAEAVREMATSKDGTQVPVNIVRMKGAPMDGSQPALLTGYGGYGVSMRPRFSRHTVAWLRHGGVYALANIRGGGEFGEDWHLGGNLTKKQHVFDDFIASAELLVARGYTKPERLGIQGGSNGGLLMGAVMVQRPELFRAVVSGVGLYDMLRVELTPNGAFNVTEFGTVKDEAQFKALYAYSPYHHVRDGVAYPAVLLTTGEHDGRVEPWMSYKMAARLQAANPGGHPVLLRVASDAGHGMGTSLASEIDEQADELAFLFGQLGMR
ncbi:MAG: S9 family peptidase [Rhizobacter sp.]|nr:S9 family peptidase [Rhizobacter sp.]